MKQVKKKIVEKTRKVIKRIKNNKHLNRIKNNKELIKLFLKCKTANEKKFFLKKGSDEFIKSILEIVINVMQGNIQLSQTIKDKLKKYIKVLRRLICSAVPLQTKRQILVQKGGFLTTLLPLVIGGVLDFVFKSDQ